MKPIVGLALVASLCLVGCKADREAQLPGKWEAGTVSLELKADKTWSGGMAGVGTKVDGTWTFANDVVTLKKVSVGGQSIESVRKQIDGFLKTNAALAAQKDKIEAELADDTLRLSPDGKTMTSEGKSAVVTFKKAG